MPLAGHRILIVDDDISYLDGLDAMAASLRAEQVIRSDCGENAVATLTAMNRPVDCILTNYGMPRGNGLQLLQYIRMGRVKTHRPDACVVMYSSERLTHVIETAKALDVSGYLLSPITPERLAAAIHKGRTRYFKVDFARYGALQIPEYVVGGAADRAATPTAAAIPPRPIDEGDAARREMANVVLDSIRAAAKAKAKPDA